MGPVHELSHQWSHRLALPLAERSDATKIKNEYVSKLMHVGSFYSVPPLQGDGQLRVFCLLKLYSGHEKLVDSSRERDRRDEAAVQMYSV